VLVIYVSYACVVPMLMHDERWLMNMRDLAPNPSASQYSSSIRLPVNAAMPA
jgi:hypothetical protein